MTDNYVGDQATAYHLTMTEEGKAALNKAVQDEFARIFKEKMVIVDCPYAEAVEFGTTPSKADRSGKTMVDDPETGERISEVKLKFRNWIGEKEGLTGKERKRKGDAIYHHVMENGAAPHPYIRPAIEDLLHSSPEDITMITGIEDIGDACTAYLATKMKMYLEKNESIATGALKDSIKIVPSILAESVRDVDIREDRYNWKPGQVRR